MCKCEMQWIFLPRCHIEGDVQSFNLVFTKFDVTEGCEIHGLPRDLARNHGAGGTGHLVFECGSRGREGSIRGQSRGGDFLEIHVVRFRMPRPAGPVFRFARRLFLPHVNWRWSLLHRRKSASLAPPPTSTPHYPPGPDGLDQASTA